MSTPVEIIAPSPVPVTVVDRRAGPKPGPDGSLPATTTVQQDAVVAGQRRINLIWESTQAVIAIVVVIGSVILVSVLSLAGKGADFPDFLTALVMLVVGFYFSRTNHTKTGGTSERDSR